MKTLKIQNRWILTGCIIFSFILYGNTLFNKYCLDDAIVITKNKFTQRGFDGIKDIFSYESFTGFFGTQKELVAGARYRPLSIATFAIEKEIFGNNPAISHFINILLYALSAFFLFLVLKPIFPKDPFKAFLVPLLVTVLFLFHPIHTEVVANIKGRDEILALLLSLVACFLVIKGNNKTIYLVFASLSWFLALLSKENAFAFLFIMPLLLYGSGVYSYKEYLKPLISFLIAGSLFFYIRNNVIGATFPSASNELMNNSFLAATVHQKYATIFYTLGKYLQLLIFPHPLTYDYYPYHIQLADWKNFLSIFSLIFYIFITFGFIFFIRKMYTSALSIAFYLIPLIPVMNLFFPIGTFMSERFIYFSSVGFCLFLASCLYYIYNKWSKTRILLYSILPILLILYGYKTIERNKAWYNDYTLFTTDVKTSVNSAKSNCSAGGALLESTDTITNLEKKNIVLRTSMHYLQKAIQIHPRYADAWLLLGNVYFKLDNRFDSAVYCYTSILQMNPGTELAKSNLFAVAENSKNPDFKINTYNTILQYDPQNFLANYKLGNIYGKDKNDLDHSLIYLNKALSINPNSKDVYIDLGVAYGLKKEFKLSAEMLEMAYNLDKNDINICINLGLTYQFIGNIVKAKEFFARADSLKKGKQ